MVIDTSREWARATQSRFRRRSTDVLLSIGLGFLPLVLARKAFTERGFPLGNELFSNLIPALHVRHAFLTSAPLLHAPWFQGRPIWANPMFKGFYPPAWPLFIPVLSLKTAVEIVLAAHLAAIPVIAYWCAREDVSAWFATPYAATWIFIAWPHFSGGQLEKLFAFPFVVLAVHQLRLGRLKADSRRAGLVAGLALGMAFLGGGMYYTFYIGLFALVMVLAFRAWTFARTAALGALVGVPHIISILPSLIGGSGRGAPDHGLSLLQQAVVISGLHPVTGDLVPLHLVQSGFAPIGIAGLALAASGLWVATTRGGGDEKWAAAVLLVTAIGGALATGFAPLYWIPGVGIFNTAGRATDLVAFGALLLGLYAVREYWSTRPPVMRVGAVGLLVTAAVTGAAVQPASAHFAADSPDEGRAIADALVEHGCDSAWLEYSHSWSGKLNVRPAPLSFAVAEAGVTIRGGHYGDIGQEWRVHGPDGTPTFEALVVGSKPPKTAHLTKPFDYRTNNAVGTIEMSNWGLIATVPLEEDSQKAYLYAFQGSCA